MATHCTNCGARHFTGPAASVTSCRDCQSYRTETTPEGEQHLIPGVEPIAPVQRLQQRQDAPLRPSKGQRRADHGLFDTAARTQLGMFD